jgi:hypothetical protein
MKFQKEIILNSQPRNFFEFSFEIHLESKEIPREKVVPLIQTFKTVFYFRFLELEKVLFGSKEIERVSNLNSIQFERFLTRLTRFIPGQCPRGPHVSAPPSSNVPCGMTATS